MGLLSHSLNALSLTLTQGKEGGGRFFCFNLTTQQGVFLFLC